MRALLFAGVHESEQILRPRVAQDLIFKLGSLFGAGQEGTEIVQLGEVGRVEMFRREKRQTVKGVLMGGVIGFAPAPEPSRRGRDSGSPN